MTICLQRREGSYFGRDTSSLQLPAELGSWREQAEAAVEEAARRLRVIYERGHAVQTQLKADNTPVTEADFAVDEYLRSALPEILDVTIVTEETYDPNDPRSGHFPETYWLVDPVDGTQNFINRDDEFSIVVALVSSGVPILGVICPAAKHVMYSAHFGGGAAKILSGKRTSICHRHPADPPRVVASKLPSESAKKITADFLKRSRIPEANLGRAGSAYKSGLLAEGLADAVVCFDRMWEWDIAAADCILNEAGCFTVDLATLKPQRYNTSLERKFQGYLAAHRSLEFVEVFLSPPDLPCKSTP